MENKTAVEWLIERLQNFTWYDEDGLPNVPLNLFEVGQAFDLALKLEKQQIMQAFEAGDTDGFMECSNLDDNLIARMYQSSEHYFCETYKKPKSDE